jgi:putative transposase
VSRGLRTFAEPKGGEVIELNVQVEHVDLVVMIAPKRSIWELVGLLQGKTAIRVFNRFRHRKPKP